MDVHWLLFGLSYYIFLKWGLGAATTTFFLAALAPYLYLRLYDQAE